MKGSLVTVATDGHRLGRATLVRARRRGAETGMPGVIIPRKTVDLLAMKALARPRTNRPPSL
jgi:DNA polymerase III sliding clamp (beta) subunit (PCNA family)